MSVIVKSGVPGKVPTTSQLEYGQLALNYADQKIYFKNSANQVVQFGQTYTNNLDFSGTGLRIRGDFSSATLSNRLSFQTGTTNGATALQVIPNGTGLQTQYTMYTDSAVTNGPFGDVTLNTTLFRLRTGVIGTGTAVPMTFEVNGAERMRMDTSGNVGLGTTVPLAKIHVDVANPANGIVSIFRNIAESALNGSGILITQNGIADWVIGQPAATNAFVIWSGRNTSAAGIERLRIDASGNTTFTGTLIESSTIRIKENVRTITNGLDIILKLRGVVYDRIDTSQKNEPGLIAEEVAEVVKDLVVYDEMGIPSGVKYTKTIAYLIEAVKEQQKLIEDLQRRVK